MHDRVSQIGKVIEPVIAPIGEEFTLLVQIVSPRQTANPTQRLVEARFWRVYCLLELGDMVAVDAEIEAYGRLAEEMKQPLMLSFTAMLRAMRALMLGLSESARNIGWGYGDFVNEAIARAVEPDV